AVARVETSDVVGVLRGEKEHAGRSKERRMRIADVVRELVFRDVAGFRIELSDVALRVGGEPEIAVLVQLETVGSGCRCLRRVFLELAGLWIEAPQHVGKHARPPDA